MNKRCALFCATLGPIGSLPAPGTMATLVTLLLVYVAWYMHISVVWYAVGLSVFTVCSWLCINKALEFFSEHDPSPIVLDEVIGCCVVFCGVPLTWVTVLVGFALFRIFDIYKPFGIAYLERMGGASGILLDDIAAGIVANVVLQLFIY